MDDEFERTGDEIVAEAHSSGHRVDDDVEVCDCNCRCPFGDDSSRSRNGVRTKRGDRLDAPACNLRVNVRRGTECSPEVTAQISALGRTIDG